jgi:dipeptide/tripeptide permease
MLASQSNDLSRKNLEWTILILSSALLGIWAAKETIALRNILLVVGTLLSIYFIAQEFKRSDLKEQCDFWRVLPIFLLALTFVPSTSFLMMPTLNLLPLNTFGNDIGRNLLLSKI